MDYQSYLNELRKLNPNHKNLDYFSKNRGNVVQNMLINAVERERRIRSQKNPETIEKVSSIDVKAPIDDESSSSNESDDDDSPEIFRKRIIKKNPNFDFDDLSPEMKDKYNEIGSLYQERTALHEKSKIAEISQDDRANAIKDAHDISTKIGDLYAEIDNFIANQQNSSASTEVVDKIAELQRVRTACSRMKTKIDKAADSEKPALESKLAELVAKKEELESWQKSLK